MAEKKTSKKENEMRKIMLEKLVINIGTGNEKGTLANARRLLELITNKNPSNAYSKKRNPAFKIVQGQQIGAFVTIRGNQITPLAKRLLDSVDNRIRETSVTNNSVSFGIREYIDISGVKYDPKIGMLGMNVNLSFKRKGSRVTLRKRKRSDVPQKHRVVGRPEIKDYMTEQFKVEFI
jgi:large subunit ribosomal protein L5